MMKLIAVMIGTFAFSILFSIPLFVCFDCALIGGIGYLVYSYLVGKAFSFAFATLFSSMIVIILARILAVYKKTPATLLIIAGIFPLIPGAGIYWTTYYLVSGNMVLALSTGYEAIKIAFALVLGIVIVFEIPQHIFNRLKR